MLHNKRTVSTIGFYLRPLRSIFNEAIAERIVEQELYPFGKYKASNGFEVYLLDPTKHLLNANNKPSQILMHEGYVPK